MSSLWVSQLSFMVRNTWYTRLTRREFALAHRLEGFRPEASDPVTLGPMTKQRITIVREVGKSQAVHLGATGKRGTNCQRLEGLLASPSSWIYTTSQSVKHLLFGHLGGHSGPNYISLKQSKQNIKCVGLSHTHLGTTWWYYKAFLHPLRQIHREFTMINYIHFMVKKKKRLYSHEKGYISKPEKSGALSGMISTVNSIISTGYQTEKNHVGTFRH